MGASGREDEVTVVVLDLDGLPELPEASVDADAGPADRLLALRSELEQAARDELVRSALREGAALSAMKSEVEEAEAEEAVMVVVLYSMMYIQ